MRRLLRWFLFMAQLVFVGVLLAAGVASYVVYQMVTPAGEAHPRGYDLAPGANPASVAAELESQKVIRSAPAFQVLLRVTRTGTKLQAGRHVLSPSMTPWQVIGELTKPTQLPGIRLTIPEGKTLRQVAALVEQHTNIPAQDVLALAHSPQLVFPERKFLPTTSMEGYLFPDTFNVSRQAGARQVLDMMLKRFEQEVLPLVPSGRGPGGLDLHQVITLASLVEAEVQVPAERPRIAAVYFNRLSRDMFLECDATVLYALQVRKKVISLDDLKVESPYNTYRNKGLPPGPICNPGLAAIKAVLNPEKSSYLYYVRNDVKNDGSHVFARTYSEHQSNIRKFQR